MLTRSLLTLLCVLFLVSVSHALEPGDTLWTRIYGGSGGQYGRSVQQTSDGGYIIAGRTKSGVDSYDVYLLRTDFSGDTLWTRTYGGSDYDDGYSVRQTSDGGYIIAGLTESFGAGLSDVYLVRTDSSGDTLWTRTYGGSREDRGYSVRQTSDGGYIIAGETHSFGGGLSDVYLLKTDSSGDTLWTGTYGGRINDWGYSVQQTSDGGYIIAGRTESFGAGLSGVYLVKTDSFGDTLWTRTHGGTEYDRGESVQQTSDGGYIIAGVTESFGAGLSDVYLLKTDSSGDTLWTRTYGGSDYDVGWSVQQTSEGGYIIAGETYSFGAGLSDVYLVRTDSSGDSLWTCAYGGSERDRGYSVQQTRDGGYVIAGATYSFGAGSSDVYLIGAAGGVMIGCDNSSAWSCPGSYFLFKLRICNLVGENISGSLTFSGHSGYNCDPMNVLVSIARTKTYPPGVTEQYYRYWISKLLAPGQYSVSIGGTLGNVDLFCCMNTDIVECGPWRIGDNTEWDLVEVDRSEVSLPTITELYQNYPNFFNASTLISYQLAATSDVKLEVYNLLGEKVATLVDSKQQAGYKSVVWDGSQVSSGLYFYKLMAGDYTETRRMMVVK